MAKQAISWFGNKSECGRFELRKFQGPACGCWVSYWQLRETRNLLWYGPCVTKMEAKQAAQAILGAEDIDE